MAPNSFVGPANSGPPSGPYPGSPVPSNASTPGPAGGPSPFPSAPGGGPPSSIPNSSMLINSGPMPSPMGSFPCSSSYSSPTPSGPHMNGSIISLGGPGMMVPMVPMGPMSNGPHPGPFPNPGGPGHGFSGPGGPFGPGGPPFGPGGPMHGGPLHGPGGPHPMMGQLGPMDRIDQGRRHTPCFSQPDYRIHELNKRLQQRTEDSDNLWWDAFTTEFFEDDATLTLTFCLEDGPKRYTIGRTLIPRYFRSIFDGGVTELYYTLKHTRESFHNTSITLECEHCTMVTHHGKPMYIKVCADGKLILEFTFDDLMRIKSWHFAVRGHRELIPRSVIAMQQDPSFMDTLAKNITRQGLNSQTLNYLRLCVILEPMQELMSRHKAYALAPRDCLKTTLFQKWQRMIGPPGGANHASGKNGLEGETQRAPNKRRKRKGSQSGQNATTNSTANSGGKKRSPGPNFNLASQVSDVMVVGEPSLMGGEFGDEDERLITRLENTQYDTASVEDGSGPNQGNSLNGPPGGPPSQGPGPSGALGPVGGPGLSAPYGNSPMSGGGGGGGPTNSWGDPSRPPADGEKKSPGISQ